MRRTRVGWSTATSSPRTSCLDERKHVYLADFGLTRHIAGGDAPALEARSLGTIDYIAPEQIRGEEIDGRADLYSLGCLLYECLTGAPPFRRPSELAVAFAHLEEEPPAPPELEGLMKKALAKAPEDRYQSGRELVSAARTALGLDAPQRRRWPLLVAAAVIALVAAGSLSVPPDARRKYRRCSHRAAAPHRSAKRSE